MNESLPSSPKLPKKACCTPANEQGAMADGADGDGYVSPKPPPVTGIERVTAGSTAGMVRLDGGSYRMGTDGDEGFPDDHEGPSREVAVAPFWVDETLVTNRQFVAFVKDTGYVTEAEKFGWSFVFHNQLSARALRDAAGAVQGLQWWLRVDGADWAHPEGPDSKLKNRMDHPVVHMSWHDAAAYAAWAGKRLPTEAEWEFACRGGHESRIFPWGDELEPAGRHLSNVFQGDFPRSDSAADGFAGPSPVKSYPANDYGLYDMTGNVWEWINDWWVPDFRHSETGDNPFGPSTAEAKMMKGGSFLCHDSYCNRYRCAARTANSPDSATINCGFRTVRDV